MKTWIREVSYRYVPREISYGRFLAEHPPTPETSHKIIEIFSKFPSIVSTMKKFLLYILTFTHAPFYYSAIYYSNLSHSLQPSQPTTPLTLNVHMTFLVRHNDMWGFPKWYTHKLKEWRLYWELAASRSFVLVNYKYFPTTTGYIISHKGFRTADKMF